MTDRSTSIKRLAIRSVWKSDLPPAVRVVAKNVRAHPVALLGSDGREGFDIARAKAHHPFATAFGTTEVVPWHGAVYRRFIVFQLFGWSEMGHAPTTFHLVPG